MSALVPTATTGWNVAPDPVDKADVSERALPVVVAQFTDAGQTWWRSRFDEAVVVSSFLDHTGALTQLASPQVVAPGAKLQLPREARR